MDQYQPGERIWVTLRVARFTPKPARERAGRGSSPFAKPASSPFADASQRTRPARARGKRWTQEYRLHAYPHETLLDLLLTVKRTLDPTLAFRYSCGHGMCGSDAVAINGTPTLLCTAKVQDWMKPLDAERTDAQGFRKTAANSDQLAPQDSAAHTGQWAVDIAPLPGFPVVKDLVADIEPMMEQIKRLKPYLQHTRQLKTTPEGKVDVFEYLQKPEELAKYEVLSNCIACGVCEGSCPVYAGGEAFVGPAAVVVTSRFMNDSRDDAFEERLQQIGEPDAAPACQSVRACSMHCPKGIDVGDEIWKVIEQVNEHATK